MANKIRDLRRQRFGRLVAIKREYNKEKGQSYWLCLCDCGNKKLVSRKHLLGGNTNSCGCLASESTSVRSWKGCGEISGTYWHDITRNAKYRDIVFEITIEQAWNKFLEQNRRCFLTGEELVFYKRRKKDCNEQTASLDRLDNNLGYTLQNCVWVHKLVNRLKSDFSLHDLLHWSKRIVDYNEQKNTSTSSSFE